jgi:chemotaxis protein CheD
MIVLPHEPLAEVILQPGDYYFGEAPTRIKTLLGSCIAMTLWHPRVARGGMVHCLLPTRGAGSGALELSGRFVDEGLRWLFREAVRSGIDPGQCEFKLFGGSNMFAAFGLEPGRRVPIGEANAKKAIEMMERLDLCIRVKDVGGSVHRALVFDLSNGNVWVRYGEYEPTQGSNDRDCA